MYPAFRAFSMCSRRASRTGVPLVASQSSRIALTMSRSASAIEAASRIAVDSSSSCGTTWFAIPIRSAVAASTKLPVSDISRAQAMPTRRGRSTSTGPG
jgi:hypothetical protein